MELNELKKITDNFKITGKMPTLFIGHGNPMNALYDNPFTRNLKSLGESLKEIKPNAILVVSAHWLTNGTAVAVTPKPQTIHDFGGFPEELFKQQYPAPGAQDLALETKQLITSTVVQEDQRWGLDHGAWTVLTHMFPEANIPVFELSIDYTKPPEYHYNLATELKSLRKKGVLIIGSGNLVHNLYKVNLSDHAKPFDWAVEFDEVVKAKLISKQYDDLMNYRSIGASALLSIPTNDHYLPVFYTLGVTDKDEELKFTYEEIQNASISMRCFQIG
jgi:4,5-DOPA dioxygenase extradiol